MKKELSGWKRLSQRVLAMSPQEIASRLRQQAVGRADALRYRFGFSFEPSLIAKPVADREPKFFFSADSIPYLCRLLQERFPEEAKSIVQRSERICQHSFDLLGYGELDYGPEIDWHLDRVHGRRAPREPFYKIHYLDFVEVGDSKVIWELNRHQHFVTLAKAFRLTADPKYSSELLSQWSRWLKENPYPIGINWASSLEVALRSLSWIWTLFLLSGTPLLSDQFRSEFHRALGISARHIEMHLSTYFSPNTHLLGEGVALFFIGTLCPELKNARHWQSVGWQIVQTEASRQVRSDGLHYEQSIYYHVYALDLFLHALVLASVNAHTIPADFEGKITKMCEALCILGRSGPVPRFGDDDGGRLFDASRNRTEHLLDPLATGAVLFGRGDFKAVSGGLIEETLWLLGESGVAEYDRLPDNTPSYNSHAFFESGLYVMCDGQQQLVVDAGPQGADTAGHGHADALSIALNSRKRSLLTDPGTFEYVGAHGDRDRFRGSRAHNTLVADGSDQALPRGPFSWSTVPAVKAEGWISGENFDLFVGSHDGYRCLPNPLLHRRYIFFRKKHFWLVRDQVIGMGRYQLEQFWHFPPGLSSSHGNGSIVAESGVQLWVLPLENQGWAEETLQDEWSPAYGRKERSATLRFSKSAVLPAEFSTLVMPCSAKGAEDSPRFVRANESNERAEGAIHAYLCKSAGVDHYMVFAERGRWTFGQWSSDAAFLYWSDAGAKDGRLLICCDASYVEANHKRIITSKENFLRCELTTTEEGVHMVSSAENVVIDEREFRLAISQNEGNSETCSGVEKK